MSEEPPVRVLARRSAVRNRVLEVFLDHLRFPDGAEVETFMVVAPHGGGDATVFARGVTGVAVLAETAGAVALIRVWRHAIGAYTWELPRGFVDGGEDPAAAGRRELREETGLEAAADLVDLGLVEPEPGILAARTQLYLARDCRATGEREAEPGHAELRLVPLPEAEAMAERGEIREACTLIALLRRRLRGDG